MKTTIAVCVPSVHVASLLNRAFKASGFNAKAFKSRPPSARLVEFLPCPIEPSTKAFLWIEMQGDVDSFFANTFLNSNFVQGVIAKASQVDDKMAMECIMAACAARAITLSSSDTRTMLKTAKATGGDSARKHLAENILGIPSLTDLLLEFVESVIAGSALSAPRRPTYA
jgi:hypothetical protein